MTPEEKITGQEPASSMNIERHALLQFMAAFATKNYNAGKAAREAQKYFNSFLAVANGEIYEAEEDD